MKFLPAAASVLLTVSASPLFAADLYWGSTVVDAPWQNPGNWYQEAGGTTPATAFPGATDHAHFNITSLNGTTVTPALNANVLVNAITFNNTVAMTLTSLSGNRSLAVGAGGITLSNSAASVTLGTSASGRNVFVKIQESQTWTNNSSSTFNVRNSSQASDTAAGPVVLTLNAAGSGAISNSGAFSDGAAGSLGLVIDSAGTGSVQIANSNYSGGTTIKRGILQANGVGIGTAEVKLGDTTGQNSATLRINTNGAVATALNVQAGNTGVNTLEFTHASGGDYDGAVAINNQLNVGVRSGQTSSIDGVISGTGSLSKVGYQGGSSSGTLLLTAVNTYRGNTTVSNGVLTLADDAALTFYIGADGETNSIGGTGTINLNGDFIFNLSGAAVADGNSWQIVNVATLNETFGSTFSVVGFTQSGNLWTNGTFTFDTATGMLTAVPEPSVSVLFGGAILGLVAFLRRKV